MADRTRALWLKLSASLAFVPGVIVVLFAAVGVVLVEVDRHLDLSGVSVVFAGDDSAARTVLSVIAGSLITVAGLTFSITMVVLQLASSQFSPRVLRSFFADRMTQVTIGVYVGTFVYSILVLRAVGSFGDSGFVPRLSITLASLLGIGSAILLIPFLQHVSGLVQVSHVTWTIGQASLQRAEVLYPADAARGAADDDVEALLAAWASAPSADLHAARPGYVQRVGVELLSEALDGRAERAAVLVRAGDFVAVDQPVLRIWPPETGDDAANAARSAIAIGSERDLDQDVDFGLRQLADIALKAVSPGINDPATAITCIGYLRSVLCSVAPRPFSPPVRQLSEGTTLVLRQRSFAEFLDPMVQISRFARDDAWVVGSLLAALIACAQATRDSGRADRTAAVRRAFDAIVEQARPQLVGSDDRARIEGLVAAMADV